MKKIYNFQRLGVAKDKGKINVNIWEKYTIFNGWALPKTKEKQKCKYMRKLYNFQRLGVAEDKGKKKCKYMRKIYNFQGLGVAEDKVS